MSAEERLRQDIDQEQTRLRANVPAAREAAIVALLRARDQRQLAPGGEARPDLITGRALADLGGNKVLQLALESESAADGAAAATDLASEGLDAWAASFLADCDRLAEAEVVLAHHETGFMRLVDDGQGRFDAWIATRRVPTSWRERAEIDWWAAWLARRHLPEMQALRAESGQPGGEARYRQLADVHLAMMAYQFGYPPDAAIGGCPVQTFRDVLGRLIAWALQAWERGEALLPRSERALIAALATDLAADQAVIEQALTAFTLDRESAAWHAAAPGVAAAPLVRTAPDRIVWSLHGLLTEPLLFLGRELRRRDAEAYHNSAWLREDVFRQELYALFPEKRFVTSAGRVKLRRADGDVRTDIDAVVFDRKTGTLGLFELKSQDPFARSPAELRRQRDNVLYANRQLSAVLDWLKRHGADELLRRVDARTAKTFRVQKVYPFVLGRYLARFSDGSEPDRRAAWAAWPELLRQLDGQPIEGNGGNPLASLFNRLAADTPPIRVPTESECPSREIVLDAARLVVHPSFAAYQKSAAGRS